MTDFQPGDRVVYIRDLREFKDQPATVIDPPADRLPPSERLWIRFDEPIISGKRNYLVEHNELRLTMRATDLDLSTPERIEEFLQ